MNRWKSLPNKKAAAATIEQMLFTEKPLDDVNLAMRLVPTAVTQAN
jgi:hypothetical protein